ncbi:MAG: hypothetical protein FJ267_08860 [Planctomycetes bacterium]|nr:hypothetical protein [Planctomycetota bacterium]
MSVNDAPAIREFGPAVTYIENDPAILIDTNVIVADPDSANLNTGILTVQLVVNPQSTDILAIRNQGTGVGQIGIVGANVTFSGITIGTVAGGTGAAALQVTLNSNATPTMVQAILRNVTFRNTSENPSTLARTLRVTLTDGDGGTSIPVSMTINVTKVNDAPVIGGFQGSVSFTENGVAVVVDGDATIADVDSLNLETGKLIVQLINNSQSTDRLEIRNQGVSAGQIGVNGSNVTFGGVIIGTFVGGTGSTALVVTLNTSATPTMVQSLLRNITFRSTSENPSTTARVVRVTLTDGDGGTSNQPTKTINVVAVNDAPVISGFAGAVNYSAVTGAPVLLDTDATIADVDSANLQGGKLTIGLSANAQSTDVLSIRNQGTGAGQIGVNGSNITFGGVVIGTFTGGTGSVALVVTFNASATPTMAQAVLRNITYRSTSATPSTLARTVKVSLTDGDGGTSNMPTKQINVVV